jgi:pimeloyl-ACP methyl ester carboxylesterase
MSDTSKTIYFIPGTMCDERLWAETWDKLSLSLVGYTFKNLPIPSLNNIDKITQALSLKLPNNSCLVGFSLGGYIASNIALKHPNKVANLMLISNMSSALPEKETKERSRTIQWINTNGYNGIPNKRIQHLLHPNAHKNQEIIQIIKDMDSTLGKSVLLHQLNVTTQRENLLPSLCKLAQPMKFLIGDTDNLVDIDKIENQLQLTSIDQTQRKHDIEIVKNTGHMLPLEQPSHLAQTIVSWICNTTK